MSPERDNRRELEFARALEWVANHSELRRMMERDNNIGDQGYALGLAHLAEVAARVKREVNMTAPYHAEQTAVMEAAEGQTRQLLGILQILYPDLEVAKQALNEEKARMRMAVESGELC